MKILIFFIGLIIAAMVFAWCVRKLVRIWFNLGAFCKHQKHPENAPRTGGLVFNKKTGKLEEDSRIILPFWKRLRQEKTAVFFFELT